MRLTWRSLQPCASTRTTSEAAQGKCARTSMSGLQRNTRRDFANVLLDVKLPHLGLLLETLAVLCFAPWHQPVL